MPAELSPPQPDLASTPAARPAGQPVIPWPDRLLQLGHRCASIAFLALLATAYFLHKDVAVTLAPALLQLGFEADQPAVRVAGHLRLEILPFLLAVVSATAATLVLLSGRGARRESAGLLAFSVVVAAASVLVLAMLGGAE